MNYEDALTFFSQKKESIQPTNGIGLPEDFDEDEEQPAGNNTGKARSNASVSTPTQKTGGKTPMLDNFSVDLTQAAREGKLDPIVGREKEILRVSEILCRRKKNNPILIGEPGVGKSAIVEGLAQLIAKNKIT